MNRKFRILLLALIIAMIAIPFYGISAYASDPVKWEELSTGDDQDSSAIYGIEMVAMQFTTGTTAHSVTSVKLFIQKVGTPAGNIVCSIRTASAGLPTGNDLTYGTYSSSLLSTSPGWITFTMNIEYSLQASTQYAIVLSFPTGVVADYVEWRQDAGGGLASAESSHSHNNGESWTTDSPVDCLFQIWGNSVLEIIDVKVFQSYLVPNDLLFCVLANVNYPPYATTDNSKDYFQVQLLNVAGTTILGASNLTAWGYKPQSIYLSASSAASITISAAYKIRIIGTFASPPSTTRTLITSDWLGNDLAKLDDWILKTADKMQNYYNYTGGLALTTYVTNSGQMLTDFGGAYFTNAINGIGEVRPLLFTIIKSKPLFPSTTPNNVYDATDYHALVGTTISDDLDTFGNLFSITGKNLAGWLMVLAIGAVVLVGVILGGGAAAIPIFVISGLPLLFIGNYLRLIGIQWTLVLAVAMFLLFIRQFWWKST